VVKTAIFLLMSVLVSACSVFGVRSGYEQASYEVIERLSDRAEVRRYPPLVAAEATIETANDSMGRSQAFQLLFKYISGANRTNAKVAMTTPVETAAKAETIAMTVPVERLADTSAPATLRFFLPASYTLETAPQPTNPKVRIVELPARTVAVLRFTGSTGDANVARHVRQLEALLHATAWQVTGPATALFYDPPWTLPFLRRNEVALPVRPRAG
jgi:hypothetical protein